MVDGGSAEVLRNVENFWNGPLRDRTESGRGNGTRKDGDSGNRDNRRDGRLGAAGAADAKRRAVVVWLLVGQTGAPLGKYERVEARCIADEHAGNHQEQQLAHLLYIPRPGHCGRDFDELPKSDLD